LCEKKHREQLLREPNLLLFEFLSKFTSDDKLIDIVFTSIQHAEKYYSICDRSIASDLMHNLKL